jgi:hypothetical protein
VHRSACLLTLLATASCGGDSELTCEYLADPGNCWADLAGQLGACLPVGGNPAIFEPTRESCTYADGTRVVFEGPLPQQVEDIGDTLGRLSFSIEKDGETCASFVDTFNNRMEITVGSQTAVSQLRGDTFSIICPGGGTHSSNFDRIFDCAREGIPTPTDGFNLEPTFFTWGVGAVTTGVEDLIRCEVPATTQ